MLIGLMVCAAQASSALASPKVLEISAEGHTVKSSEAVSFNFSEGFLLTTTHGEELALCETEADGLITTNDASKDVFAQTAALFGACYLTHEPDLGEEGQFEVPKITFGVNGKAEGSVEIQFAGPAPYQHCMYKSSTLKGVNTTTGWLGVGFHGKLKGNGCHLKTVAIEPSGASGVPSLAGWGERNGTELVASVK